MKTKCHIFIKLLINIFTLCFLTLPSPLKGMKRVTFCHLSKEHSTSKMEDILVNEPINQLKLKLDKLNSITKIIQALSTFGWNVSTI